MGKLNIPFPLGNNCERDLNRSQLGDDSEKMHNDGRIYAVDAVPQLPGICCRHGAEYRVSAQHSLNRGNGCL